jgi:hypothetical protein
MQIWGGVEELADVHEMAKAELKKNPKLINGPKLDGERGYVSQREIDAMFAARS